jgi:hypothetical protein
LFSFSYAAASKTAEQENGDKSRLVTVLRFYGQVTIIVSATKNASEVIVFEEISAHCRKGSSPLSPFSIPDSLYAQLIPIG